MHCRAVDSTGIEVEGEGEWNARKHGGPKRRLWRKIHLGIDEQTLEVRAVEFTGSGIGDAPMLKELLDQIPPEQGIGNLTTADVHHVRGAHSLNAREDIKKHTIRQRRLQHQATAA